MEFSPYALLLELSYQVNPSSKISKGRGPFHKIRSGNATFGKEKGGLGAMKLGWLDIKSISLDMVTMVG